MVELRRCRNWFRAKLARSALMNPMTLEEKRNLAWVGDAVLALFARRWILQQTNILNKERAEVFQAMTSNEFLSHFGEPTKIECEIGDLGGMMMSGWCHWAGALARVPPVLVI